MTEQDFDFFHGRWQSVNRKLRDVTDPSCTEWVEFEASSECWPILGGLGNVDTFYVPSMPGVAKSFHGATLRMYNPQTGTWRIWWMSTRYPGRLDESVEGKFEGSRGIFEGADQFGDNPILVRYEWDVLGEDKCQWAQRFSWDDGKTWEELNWIATHTRVS